MNKIIKIHLNLTKLIYSNLLDSLFTPNEFIFFIIQIIHTIWLIFSIGFLITLIFYFPALLVIIPFFLIINGLIYSNYKYLLLLPLIPVGVLIYVYDWFQYNYLINKDIMRYYLFWYFVPVLGICGIIIFLIYVPLFVRFMRDLISIIYFAVSFPLLPIIYCINKCMDNDIICCDERNDNNNDNDYLYILNNSNGYNGYNIHNNNGYNRYNNNNNGYNIPKKSKCEISYLMPLISIGFMIIYELILVIIFIIYVALFPILSFVSFVCMLLSEKRCLFFILFLLLVVACLFIYILDLFKIIEFFKKRVYIQYFIYGSIVSVLLGILTTLIAYFRYYIPIMNKIISNASDFKSNIIQKIKSCIDDDDDNGNNEDEADNKNNNIFYYMINSFFTIYSILVYIYIMILLIFILFSIIICYGIFSLYSTYFGLKKLSWFFGYIISFMLIALICFHYYIRLKFYIPLISIKLIYDILSYGSFSIIGISIIITIILSFKYCCINFMTEYDKKNVFVEVIIDDNFDLENYRQLNHSGRKLLVNE